MPPIGRRSAARSTGVPVMRSISGDRKSGPINQPRKVNTAAVPISTAAVLSIRSSTALLLTAARCCWCFTSSSSSHHSGRSSFVCTGSGAISGSRISIPAACRLGSGIPGEPQVGQRVSPAGRLTEHHWQCKSPCEETAPDACSCFDSNALTRKACRSVSESVYMPLVYLPGGLPSTARRYQQH